ncbi:MAG: hypothetical protein ACJ8CR_12335, partial [Roseiflexaceae bacterium]
SPLHPLTPSPAHPLTRSPLHPLTPSPAHPLTPSPAHPLKGVAMAGVLFGLATLTRSITLLFLPIVAIWLLFRLRTTDHRPPTTDHRPPTTAPLTPTDHGPRTTDYGPRNRMLVPLAFLLCATLTIAPWTIRNYLAYGRLIPVETGLSFNLWFFSDPHESNNEIYSALSSIPNPAARAAYATAKGLARLREDPAILLHNMWPNWVKLLDADTIEDRFIQESYYSDVGLPLFAAALIFDDALYVLILLAGAAGLALRRPAGAPGRRLAALGDPWWLVVAWVLYIIAIVLLTHGEARYRHFLYPLLIPYAGWMLVRGQAAEQTERRAGNRPGQGVRLAVSRSLNLLAIGVLWAVILGVALRAYPWGWAGQNLARGWQVLHGDLAWAIGDRAAALRAYERATAFQETPDGWLRRGDAARAQGDRADALRAYRNAMHLTPPYIAASARLGDLLREVGDTHGARLAFEGEYANQQQVVDWAWRHLRPAPTSALDVGDGLDFGYIGGVYPAETLAGETARWTGGRATVRLGGAARGQAGTVLVQLLLAAPRPDGAAVRAQVCVAGQCRQLAVAGVWRFYTLPFAATPGAPPDVEIVSETFRPRDWNSASPDDRTLGVLIGRVAIIAAPGAGAAAPQSGTIADCIETQNLELKTQNLELN